MTRRALAALYRATFTRPQLVREALDKMVADYRKPGPALVDLFTRPTSDERGFVVEIVYPAKPRRRP
jgi:hypothetical protein